MHPELFKIPFTELTIKGYGFMLVLGFLAAIYVIRRLSSNLGHSPEHITNAALYSLITGVAGARIFYVIHYWQSFKNNPIEALYVWHGGLELLGGVISAITVIIIYMRLKKLPVRKYLDILAIGLMLALAFGRMGCLLNGCCFGKPAELPWSITFPYGSIAYHSQIAPDNARERGYPYFTLPDEFYKSYYDQNGNVRKMLLEDIRLTMQQRHKLRMLKHYRCLPVHPTQIYSSMYALLICYILYRFWKRGQKASDGKIKFRRIYNSGTTFALMFIFYGPARFIVEHFRDDNPYEMWRLTISQLMGAGLFALGIVLFLGFSLIPKTQAESDIEKQ